MDDLAASQQLIDEGARAESRTNCKEDQILDDDAIESSPPARKKRKSPGARKRKATSTQQAAVAPPQVALPKQPSRQPRSYALKDLRAYADSDETNEASSGWPVSPLKWHAPNGITRPSDTVEVPDSQTAPTTADALMSPPMTSSFAVPASMPGQSMPGQSSPKKKGKKRTRKEVPTDHKLPPKENAHRSEDTPQDANEVLTPSSSRSNRKRKHLRLAAPMPSDRIEPIHDSDAEENMTRPPRTIVVDEAPETPTPAKRQKKSRRPWKAQKIGTLDAEDEIIDGSSESPEGRRQSTMSALQTESAENYSTHEETPSARPKHGDKQRKTNELDVHDWPAPVRSLGEHVDETLASGDEKEAFGDADTRHADVKHASRKRKRATASEGHGTVPVASQPNVETCTPPESSLDEDETRYRNPPEHQSSAKKRQYKKARKSRRQSEIRPRIRTSNIGLSSTFTAAEKSLNTVRDLNHPPDLRKSGEFTQDEEELIRRAIRDYQERKGLDMYELVEVIQWTNDNKYYDSSRRKEDWTTEESLEEQESKEFWEEIKQIELIRKWETICRHIRSKYHTYKRGGWTKDEDDKLKRLFDLHPRKWKLISQIMGDRSMQDVTNRWRDYVQHRDRRNTSTWSQDEESLLVRAITTVIQKDEDYRAEVGKPPLDDYTHKDINWAQVCTEMGDIRSRLQSQVKWTKMRARNPPPQIQLEIKPRKTVLPDQIAEQVDESTPRKRVVEPTPKKRGRPRKSEDMSVVGEDRPVEKPKRRRKSKKSQDAEIDRPVAEERTLPLKTSDATDAGLTFMEEEHNAELKEHHDPDADAGLGEGMGSADRDLGESTTANVPNTKRKRKMSVRESMPRSPAYSAKKRKRQTESQAGTPMAFKSTEFITESDHAESEPEL